MSDEDRPAEVVWMPGFAAAVLTLVVTQFVPLAGTALAALGLVGLVVRLPRQGWTPLTWCCLGAVIGCAVIWALLGLHAAL